MEKGGAYGGKWGRRNWCDPRAVVGSGRRMSAHSSFREPCGGWGEGGVHNTTSLLFNLGVLLVLDHLICVLMVLTIVCVVLLVHSVHWCCG